MTFSAQTDVLYGIGPFRVRLVRLAPGEQVSLSGPAQKAWLALAPGLEVSPEGGEPYRLGAGEHLVKASGQAVSVHNISSQPVRLLEIAQEAHTPEKPLEEITEVRPWGSFTVLMDEPDFKLKQLRVTPGTRLSLQRHQKREEHWLVLAGEPEVTVGERVLSPQVGEYVKIPLHAWHRLANPGSVPVEIVELQLGEYFGEDDIERREDDFGRA